MRMQKSERILSLYYSLISGDVIIKSEAALQFDVDLRTIQRDINDIRAFCADKMVMDGVVGFDIVYDRKLKGYRTSEKGGTCSFKIAT